MTPEGHGWFKVVAPVLPNRESYMTPESVFLRVLAI